MSEKYEPTSEEIQNAEAQMSPDQVKLTKTLEEKLKEVQKTSGLDETTFYEIVNSYDRSYDKEDTNRTRPKISFTTRGHHVIMDFSSGHATFLVDGQEIMDKVAQSALSDKYGKIIGPFKNELDPVVIKSEVTKKAVQDLLK